MLPLAPSPVLSVGLISGQGVLEHKDAVTRVEAGAAVLVELQLHRRVQQRQVPAHDQRIRAACGAPEMEPTGMGIPSPSCAAGDQPNPSWGSASWEHPANSPT